MPVDLSVLPLKLASTPQSMLRKSACTHDSSVPRSHGLDEVEARLSVVTLLTDDDGGCNQQ